MSSADALKNDRSEHDQMLWQRFAVEFRFPVVFTDGLFVAGNPTLADTLDATNPGEMTHRVLFVIDHGVVAAMPSIVRDIEALVDASADRIDMIAAPRILPGGEAVKTDLAAMTALQSEVAALHLDRHAWIVAIGGGALLDAVGLVAATSHRGIRHLRVPTTVLSQNDSGVGVKNGVNLYGQKNWLGTFRPPEAVINDHAFIRALPERDRVAGMAEAVKVALIRDAAFHHWITEQQEALARFDDEAMKYLIRRCAELHMQQIGTGGDPFETGNARPLDFGHWAAHRLEQLSGYQLRHGEAVALGIALDTRYSVLDGRLEEGQDTAVCRLLESLGFKLWHDSLDTPGGNGRLALLQGLADFREHLGGKLCITLLDDIGRGVEVDAMDHAKIEAAIDWLRARAGDLTQNSGTSENHPPSSESDSNTGMSPAAIEANERPAANEARHAMASRSPSTAAAAALLDQWLDQRLDGDDRAWLASQVAIVAQSRNRRDLHIALGLAPRRLGNADLSLNDAERTQADALSGGWRAAGWSIDETARTRLLLAATEAPLDFGETFVDLCRYADLSETICYYRATAILPWNPTIDAQMGEALRSNVRAVFEAVAHDNPWPRQHFDEQRWNQMVLKALFIESPLWPFVGLDERANAELARILHDYTHERRAAGRKIRPELWRCLAPHASGAMLAELRDVVETGRAHEALAIARALPLAAAGSEAAVLCSELEPTHKALFERARALDWAQIANTEETLP
ncbi:MAG: hypothetical protein CSB44_11445 [Gammaproteobacteria bacterium]|nr:MAG: hypothetical protein CSB44_11445 [Gammaproteobacteria bacterium]